jgi:hypothetical protein
MGLGIWSCHMFCVWDKFQSHPHSLSPGCPNHQGSTWLSYLGPMHRVIRSTSVLAWANPLSQHCHRDSEFPQPWGCCNKAAGQFSPKEGVSTAPWVMWESQTSPHAIRNIFKILGYHERDTTLLRNQ